MQRYAQLGYDLVERDTGNLLLVNDVLAELETILDDDTVGLENVKRLIRRIAPPAKAKLEGGD